ncbi:VWA domain-containing protein [Kroppenstedtia pulmonis]|uniref:VWA domain-containing protein n=1 Tax=Kroppenstedtia pulmonis TaxID=1380685 RepID=A0A7D3XNY0_9BACL|nr:VWA domain-containing protein [Kroppenstedtia pulmonis]QKG83162.1 VWA domain-containing protein [Kroppenstedtia pulmonis]
MKKLFFWWWLIMILFTLMVISGCSTEEQADPHKKEPEPKEEEIPRASLDPEGIMMQKPGKFFGDNYDKKKVEQALDQFPDNLSTEETYDRLVYLLGENYRPQYEELMSLDPTIQVNKKTPDGKMKVPAFEQMNVEILLDASGSMAGQVEGGMKMDLAKKAIQEFVAGVPEGAKVSLRVYGHKGSNQKKDKKVSCDSNELVYPLQSYDSDEFEKSLNQFEPTGWTPLASAIQAAHGDLKESGEDGEKTRNIVYVVSDGVETCGGDPVKEAKRLGELGIEPIVKIIGFDVDDAGQQQLKKVAKASKGSYQDIQSGEDLKEYLEAEKARLKREWRGWSISSQLKANEKWGEKINEVWDLLYKKPEGKEKGLAYMLNQETERLYEAKNYLDEKGKLEDKDHLSGIIRRKNTKTKLFFKETEVTFIRELEKAKREAKDDIKKQEKEMTDQYE